MTQVYLSAWRLTLLAGLVLFGFSTVLGRLVYLHILEQDKLAAIAERSRKSFFRIEARRGSIYDQRGNLLAATRPVNELGVDPQFVREEDFPKLGELARLIGLSEREVRERVSRRTCQGDSGFGQDVQLVRWVKLADKVEDSTMAAVRALQIRGVYGNRQYERYYPLGGLAAHLLGYVGYVDQTVEQDGAVTTLTVRRALMGVERQMDFYLQGQDGWREREHDGRRRVLPQYTRELKSTDGLNVELSLDMVIQDMVESEIARLVKEYTPAGVTIIVSDPRTGFILGMGNYPAFDPNEYWKTDTGNLRNRALTDIFEPGSTFKIVAAAAALNEGIVTPETLIDCAPDRVEYRGRVVRLPSDTHPLGTIPVSTVVSKSSNRGAARLGMLLGEDRLYQYSRAFGFGSASGFGLGGEVNGILHPVKSWDGLTISRLPAGYAVGATPMQVHLGMSVIANHGVLMVPKLVRRVFDHEGRTVLEFGPEPRHRVIRPETAQVMAQLLEGVTQPGGTATRAAIPGYRVAGKTGTARKIIDGHYSHRHHVASFTGFFPAVNPRLLITVVVDEPQLKGVGYGGTIAAPSFRLIGEQAVQYLALEPPPRPSAAGDALARSRP